ncbi:MAG: HEPN domain-containing protein, partial [Actinomycetota bacterium]|nr:HEPN domain-containing protein [Actinomycetota bacterium]
TGHDLTALGALAAEALRATLTEELRSALGRLSRHYLPSRYPDALPGGAPGDHYGKDDSLQAVTDALAVVGFVDRWWQAVATADPEAAGGSEREGRGP